MSEELTAEVKSLLKDAAAKLTGPDKRNFMAKATLGLFDGSSRKAETYMGWNRQNVEVGLHELHTGIICMDNYQARGNKRTEEKLSALESDIRSFAAIGDYSRDGQSRGQEAVKALDHDMQTKTKLVSVGILKRETVHS